MCVYSRGKQVLLKTIIRRRIHVSQPLYVTVMSSIHRDACRFLAMAAPLCLHFHVSVSLYLLPFNPLKSLIKSSCKQPFDLLIHALFSIAAACETRGWGLLSLPLIV